MDRPSWLGRRWKLCQRGRAQTLERTAAAAATAAAADTAAAAAATAATTTTGAAHFHRRPGMMLHRSRDLGLLL